MTSNSSTAIFVSTQGFNSLTLFATDHWSWHFVEPVWEHQAEGGDASCPGDGQHRFAWSGWYEYKTGGSKDALAAASSSGLSRREMAAQKEKADAVQRDAELHWLKARLDARLREMEAQAGGEGDESGALWVQVAAS